jgi:hypothetical protein
MLGARASIASGGSIVNGAGCDVEPPSTTVISAVPADAIRFADTVASSRRALTKVVWSAVPLKLTTALG